MIDTFSQLKTILVERFGVNADRVQPETDLQNQLNLDSMDALDLLLAVNNTFDVHISEKALEKINTVGQLVACIEKYKPK